MCLAPHSWRNVSSIATLKIYCRASRRPNPPNSAGLPRLSVQGTPCFHPLLGCTQGPGESATHGKGWIFDNFWMRCQRPDKNKSKKMLLLHLERFQKDPFFLDGSRVQHRMKNGSIMAFHFFKIWWHPGRRTSLYGARFASTQEGAVLMGHCWRLAPKSHQAKPPSQALGPNPANQDGLPSTYKMHPETFRFQCSQAYTYRIWL